MSSASDLSILSLFTGAGGMDLGFEAAGFEPVLCIEVDEDSRATLRHNRPNWRLAEPGNIYALDPDEVLQTAELKPRDLRLLVGGPPCQPFSKSAYWVNGNRTINLRARRIEGVGALIQRGGRAVAGMLTIATAGGS